MTSLFVTFCSKGFPPMTRAYAESYRSLASRCLGNAFDYAVHGLGMPLSEFYDRFLASPLSLSFAEGSPKIVAGISGEELVLTLLGEDEPFPWKESAGPSPEYWAGWALASFQWYSGLSFQEIASYLSIEKLLALYYPYHEMDGQKLNDKLLATIHLQKERTHLAEYRRNTGLSQQDLATLSGVSKRSIQQYEQGRKSINKASASTLEALAKALHCSIVDLCETLTIPFSKADSSPKHK
jgi:DNA-binding transcriptional regulator YiaG